MEFIDLEAQRCRLETRIDDAIAAVMHHGQFIMGPEVATFEESLSEYTGVPHVISCANGTDALVLALRALGTGAGDQVLVPSFTFAATAEAVALVGATPVFVDVDEQTFNMSSDTVRAALVAYPTAVGAVAVDLFGRPAPYADLRDVLGGRWLIADAAQSIGARHGDTMVGALADVTTTSFFPAKPLGCYGDGGAVLTTRADVASVVRSLRVHGKGTHKYDNERIGYNSRLDTIQAAILLPKLEILEDEMERRQQIATLYSEGLADVVGVPTVEVGVRSAWAQYTIRAESRDEIATLLRGRDVPTAVYYPRPLHLQTAYKDFPRASPTLKVAEELSEIVLSLPMHPYLDEPDQRVIIDAVRDAVRR